MKRVDAMAQRALIAATTGRDGSVAERLLCETGVQSTQCDGVESLVAELRAGAAMAIVAEEVLQFANIASLSDWLQDQPPWSDLPIILLSRHGGGQERIEAARRWSHVLGNVTVIERPFHPTTLSAAVASAARARYRQYEARARTDALHESEQRLSTALQAAKLGSWSLDIAAGTLSTSMTCRAHFGRRPTEDLGYEAFRSAVHPDDQGRMQATVAHAIQTGEDYIIEYRNVWPDGTVHWIDIRARALRGDDGGVTGLVGVSADISQRKSAELERERLLHDLARERSALAFLNATLEERVAERSVELEREVAAREKAQEQLRQAQKMESIGQLTGGVAHDFNNLLMAVMAALNLLRKRVPDTPQTKQLIDGALQATERGASLTQRLLAFARRQDLQTQAVKLGELIQGMRDLLDRSLGPRFSLEIEIDPAAEAVEADANQLELAILNLVINARDAMPDGGGIKIDVSQERLRDHASLPDGVYGALRVVDSGCGMDPATLSRAIEPFFSTKVVGKGTGLGLSMVHGLAVQLGGGFTLDSVPERGTTAAIFLPLASRPAEAADADEDGSSDMQSARILVVDDDALVANLTASMLSELGHTVIEVHSGEEALSFIKAGEAVDLMMTDYLMPGMTGLELSQAVRDLRPDLPILLATGYAELTDHPTIDIPRIGKPYGLDDLRERLATFPGMASAA